MRTTAHGQSALLMLDAIEVLNALRVPYAIVGAVAASYHGVVRASMDADVVVSLRAGRVDIAALTECLEQAGFKATYRPGELRDPVGAIIWAEDRFGNRVDLLMDIRGMSDAAFSRAVDAELKKTAVRMIGLEDFIAMKLYAGGPQDVSDANRAFAVSLETLNLAVLKKLVHPYGKDARQRLRALLEAHRSR